MQIKKVFIGFLLFYACLMAGPLIIMPIVGFFKFNLRMEVPMDKLVGVIDVGERDATECELIIPQQMASLVLAFPQVPMKCVDYAMEMGYPLGLYWPLEIRYALYDAAAGEKIYETCADEMQMEFTNWH